MYSVRGGGGAGYIGLFVKWKVRQNCCEKYERVCVSLLLYSCGWEKMVPS